MDFDPAVILTVQGATIGAAAIAAVIELAKKLIPGMDGWSATAYQRAAAILALALVAYSAWATNYALEPVSVGALAIAWFGIARLATATYDTAKAITAGDATG